MAAIEQDEAREPKIRPNSWYVLGVLFLCYAINAIDRQILSILAQSIKGSLGLTDAELGFLYGTTFAILYTLFGLAFARLAEVWRRVRIIAFGMAFWSVMTVFCGLAGNYTQLALARTGVGFGEASASPTAYSLIGDLFPANRRALALSIYNCGVFLGYSAALPIGGWLMYEWAHAVAGLPTPLGLANWQGAFLIAGIPGLLLAGWMLTLREPPRGGQLDPAQEAVKQGGVVRHFLAEAASVLPPFSLWTILPLPYGLRDNLIILGATALATSALIAVTRDMAQWLTLGYGAYAVGSWIQRLRATDRIAFEAIFRQGFILCLLVVSFCLSSFSTTILFWMSPYAVRTFALPTDVAAIAIGVPSGIASAFGSLVGGSLSDFARRRTRSGRLYVVMASVMLAPLFAIMAFLSASFYGYLAFLMLALVTIGLYFASLGAEIQDKLMPRIRATGAATMFISVSLGIAIGPYLSGRVSLMAGSLRIGIFASALAMPIAFLFLIKSFQLLVTARSVERLASLTRATPTGHGPINSA